MNIMQILTVAKRGVVDNAPGILTALGAVGVVSTAVLAAKATPIAHDCILEDLDENGDYKDRWDKVSRTLKVTWRPYSKTAISAISAIVCIAAAQKENLRRQAAMISAYSLSTEALRDYKEEVKSILGKNNAEKVDAGVAKKKMTKTSEEQGANKQVIVAGSGETLCYDELSGRYFKSSIEKIRCAVNSFNQTLLRDGYAGLNDFYYLLGLPYITIGTELGWTAENFLDVAYTSVLDEDGVPALAINYSTQPIRKYWKANH